ncbi:MAG: molybdenum cofactor guanylyltransferase [Methanobacteriota archaeon]
MRSGLILAGGASRRFGSPKAFAPFAGRPMIARVADVLQAFVGELVVSVADASRGAEVGRVLQATEGTGRSLTPRIVVDSRRDRGPIEGLSRGLRAARGDPVLVAPCDAPRLVPDLYRLLLDVLSDFDAAVPRLDAIDPVRAVYRRGPVVDVLEREGDRVESPSGLVDRLHVAFVGERDLRRVDPDLRSFLDVNAPEDLARGTSVP